MVQHRSIDKYFIAAHQFIYTYLRISSSNNSTGGALSKLGKVKNNYKITSRYPKLTKINYVSQIINHDEVKCQLKLVIKKLLCQCFLFLISTKIMIN